MWERIRALVISYMSNPRLTKGSLTKIVQTQTVSPIVATPIVILAGDTNAANMSAKIDELVVAVNAMAIQEGNSITDTGEIINRLKEHTLIKG